MKLCPECKSDSIERTSSIGLRVVGCVILFFIPFGFLFCWVPFILPHSFRCLVCGHEGGENQLLNIDWRDREALQEKHWQLEEKLSPIMGKWFSGTENALYKVTRRSGQFLLLRIEDREITPYRILDYMPDPITNKLKVKNISPKFRVLKEFPQKGEVELSDFGQGLFTEEEFGQISKGNLGELLHSIEKEGKLIEAIKLEIEG